MLFTELMIAGMADTPKRGEPEKDNRERILGARRIVTKEIGRDCF